MEHHQKQILPFSFYSILQFFQKHPITEDAHQSSFIKFYECHNGKHYREEHVKIIVFPVVLINYPQFILTFDLVKDYS